MRCTSWWVMPMVAVAIVSAGPTVARAGLILPAVVASIHDEPIDGDGDAFNTPPFQGLLRRVTSVPPSREDRAVVEFDLAPFAGLDLSRTTLTLTITTNNFGGASFRQYDVLLYAGDGAAELSDFSIAGTLAQRIGYDINTNPVSTFTLDVVSQLRPLLASSPFLGVRLDPIGSDNFPSILVASSLDVQAAPEPPAVLLLGLGLLMIMGDATAKHHQEWRRSLPRA